MRLYIIRHAQSENNAMWAMTGSSDGRSSDPLLSELGRRQAQYLAKRLARVDTEAQTDPWDVTDRRGFFISHIYTSLMQRAIQTATAVAQALNLPLVAWPELHEVGGIYVDGPGEDERTGLPGPNRQYFERHYPHMTLPDSLGGEGWWNRPFESRDEARLRATNVAEELFRRHGGRDDRVALITHGAFSNYLLSHLLNRAAPPDEGHDPRHPWLFTSNTGITCLSYAGGYATLYYTNRLDHLPADLITI
jgi:2,3-bisphosphoglycerate-dependent phosphoglycerate mutase